MRLTLPLLGCATLGAAFVPRGGIVTNVTPSPSRYGLLLGGCHASRYPTPRESYWSALSGFGLDPAISREVRVHSDGDGSGSMSPATPPPSAIAATGAGIEAVEKVIKTVEAKIEAVEAKIEAVEAKIEAVEAALSGGPAYLGISDTGVLLREKEQLREEKVVLLKLLLRKEAQHQKEKEQLREKELVLLKKPVAAAVPLSADKNVSGFAAALTGANVTEDTLELTKNTFFLGDKELGCKLFIRPCYKELFEIIFGGASRGDLRNIVVSGTPGIGKSVFGFYLLYLLRRERRTVVFERKRSWYRFSDEGVQKGEFSDFFRAGYMDDYYSWYLSDPEDRPFEGFRGVTVVLVSPKGFRYHEFLKQSKSKRFFMGVWSLNELLKCREAVFPGVSEAVVEHAFGVVGGVARAIFVKEKFTAIRSGLKIAANNVDVAKLITAVKVILSEQPIFQTDEIGDKLFHISSNSSGNFTKFSLEFASNYTRDLVLATVRKKGRDSLLAFAGAAIRNPDAARLIGGGSVVGSLFERGAHIVFGGGQDDNAPLKMAVLNASDPNPEVLLGKSSWNLFFKETQAFEGSSIRAPFDSDIYYTPNKTNFGGIDSFAVDSRDGTVFFFQMKIDGPKPLERHQSESVEKHWNTAVEFSGGGVSVKNCVLVLVIPVDEWEKKSGTKGFGAKKWEKRWLPGASASFLSKCSVCVVAVRTGEQPQKL